MLKLEVIMYKGVTPPQPLSAEFDQLGGDIGRGAANMLVLPDAERYISRTHAKIVFRAGLYMIENHGTSAPVMLNGRVLGKGDAAALAQGDNIGIGEYTLRTTLQQDVLPDASFENSGTNAIEALKGGPMRPFGTDDFADPFANLTSPANVSAKSLEEPIPSRLDPFSKPEKISATAAIPADFDPFANLSLPSVPLDEKAGSAEYPDLGFGVSVENRSLDDIFGLAPALGGDPPALLDSLTESSTSVASFENSPALDPMAAFGEKAASQRASSQRDDTPELHAAFNPPRGFPDPAMAKQAPAVERPADSHGDMILSWNEDGSAAGDIKTVIIAPRQNESLAGAITHKPERSPLRPNELSPAHLSAGSKPALEAAIVSAPGSQRSEPPSTPSAAVSTTPPQASAGTAQEVFIEAFLAGAGIPDFNMPSGLTPQAMHLLGQMLRETVQGMLDLLLARAIIKREIKADVTMIIAQENNPLKFSPNVESALSHLLAPQRGFMPPLEAIKDACNDLRSHQFAFMAGMRAALTEVLLRFNPEQLEQRLTQKTMLDAMLPMNRKAKIWDLFAALYSDISREAEDDFHALFGREFLRAYESQIDKLRPQTLKSKRQ